jgi:transposase
LPANKFAVRALHLSPRNRKLKRLDEIEADVQVIERRIKDWQKQQVACRMIAEIPDVGMLTATALVATMDGRGG